MKFQFQLEVEHLNSNQEERIGRIKSAKNGARNDVQAPAKRLQTCI